MTRISRLAEVARRRTSGEEGAAEEGFTLIELLVVLLIIGILLAIAIPTFLSVTSSANNTAAQSNLQTALTGAKTFYTQNNQSYSDLCDAGPANGECGTAAKPGIAGVDTGLSAVTQGTASASPHTVSFGVSTDGTTVVMVAQAQGTHDCWGVFDTTTSGAFLGKFTGPGTFYFVDKATAGSPPPTCSAQTYNPATNSVTTGAITNGGTNGFQSNWG